MLNKIEKHRIEEQFLRSLEKAYKSHELGNLPSMLAPKMMRGYPLLLTNENRIRSEYYDYS